MNIYKKNSIGFTLVELIVVVTILAILSTIGFVAYSGYLAGVRDTNRVSQLKSIADGLEMYRTRHDLPMPEDYIEVQSDGDVVAYQGYIGKNVLETIEYSSEGVDPKDGSYFSYYLTKDKKYFQLMAFLEEADNLQSNSFKLNIVSKLNAIDYSSRYPTVYGKKLGILTNDKNIPVQEITELNNSGYLELLNSDIVLSMHIDNNDSLTATGNILAAEIVARLDSKYFAPKDCPKGFIGVAGNPSFNQKGFCVAQYEMTYSDADTPDSSGGGTNRNTMHYDSTKIPVSMAGKYPIADITQEDAIKECKKIGAHLITNNEWMTIARNIVLQKENWSSGEIGIGYLYNGVSGDNSLGCDYTGGNSESRDYGTKTGEGSDISCNIKRGHYLSNGAKIWDFAGNVWEHVNGTNDLNSANGEVSTGNACGGNDWYSWYGDDGSSECDYQSSYPKSIIGPIGNYNANNGVGRIYSYDSSDRVFVRGGDAASTSTTGIFSMRLSWASTTQYRLIGFRCAK